MAEIKEIPVSELKPWPKNPRKHDVDRLVKSIEAFGFRSPLVVNKVNGQYQVEAGHGRLLAAKKLGLKSLPCVVVEDDEVTAEAYAVADNRLQDLTEWDMPALKDILEGLDTGAFDMESIGYNEKELEELMTQFHVLTEGLTDDDEIPDKVETVCKKGDLWKLGEHRLMRGDSTVITDVERLMGGEKADCMWTDPPYGVEYVGKTKDALTIDNDDKGGLLQLLTDAFGNAQMACIESGHWYIAHPPGALSLTFGDAIRQLNWRLHETLVWVKDSMVLGHTDYHYRHEPIFYGYFPGEGRPGRGNHAGSLWQGNHSQTTVFEIPRPKRSESHPTMKPVKLVEEMLQNSSQLGDGVLDLFGGSGSTLIACEKLGRRCFMCEIDPHYNDVIITRWANFTGKKAELINGQS